LAAIFLKGDLGRIGVKKEVVEEVVVEYLTEVIVGGR
jgi:hypothetical protein